MEPLVTNPSRKEKTLPAGILFWCPRCEAFTEWGTTGASLETGHCHGLRGDGCEGAFVWRREDDWRHFLEVIPFHGEEEIGEARRRVDGVAKKAPKT
jgi:hypothetical protein